MGYPIEFIRRLGSYSADDHQFELIEKIKKDQEQILERLEVLQRMVAQSEQYKKSQKESGSDGN